MDFNGNEVYKRGECPVCGFEFSCSNNMKYCFYCGQKLDWSDEKLFFLRNYFVNIKTAKLFAGIGHMDQLVMIRYF